MTSIRAARPMADSAVLVPVYRDAAGDLKLVLIVRGPRGVHGDQIGLPGGRREPEDVDLLATALREAEEEIGLRREWVDVRTELPIVETMTTAFRIAPFLGVVTRPLHPWPRQESEVAEVLDVSVQELARPEAHAHELARFATWPEPRMVSFYRVGPHKLWGATYRIVHPLIPRLLGDEIGI